MKCPYTVLGVPRDAAPEAITKAYRKLAGRHHPDRNPGDAEAEARYKEIVDAYAVLGNQESRARYDETGEIPKDRKNPTDRDYLDILQPFLMRTMQDLIGPFGRGVNQTDIVKVVRGHVETAMGQLQDRVDTITHAVIEGEKACERFEADDGYPNLLAGFIRDQIKQLKKELEGVEYEIERFGRALEYLSHCRYLTDAAKKTKTLALATKGDTE